MLIYLITLKCDEGVANNILLVFINFPKWRVTNLLLLHTVLITLRLPIMTKDQLLIYIC